MKKPKTVTFDTCVLPGTDLIRLAEEREFDVKVVSVSLRELEGTDIHAKSEPIYETAVFGESRWGESVWGGIKNGGWLESILRIISNGSFPPPGKRDLLTNGEQRQMRDAMIFEAHVREGREVFVTQDMRAFCGPCNDPNVKRRTLEKTFDTMIMTPEEFAERYRTNLEPENNQLGERRAETSSGDSA